MRTALRILALLLLAFAAYAYYRYSSESEKTPANMEKMLADPAAFVSSLAPGALHPVATLPIANLTEGKLISADGSPYRFPANTSPASIRYYAIYYSAQWCPPCHAFTPVLVQWYKSFKPKHPNFELIFVSEDHDEASMLGYMKEMAMPWPAVRFSDLKHDGGFKGSDIEQFAGSGIPDLVLVDADGKVLSDSFSLSGSYLGPQQVIADIEKLVPVATANPVPPAPVAKAAVPPSASTTSSATNSAPSSAMPATKAAVPASTPAPAPIDSFSGPIKQWAPPDVMPAQPNWSWITSDGTSYQDVVVTKIEPETVSITHSLGVAHIPISTLAPNIQKQLNYDPVAAAEARAESKREEAHPYYTFAARAEAQSVARQMHWPLAWMISNADYLSATNPEPGDEADATQMAMSRLKSQTIIIFSNGNDDLGSLSSLVRDQFFTLDDGPMPGGHHFYAPKIVISDPDVAKIFGRISYTQIKTSGEAAIDEVLAALPGKSDAHPQSNGQTASAPTPPTPLPTTAPVPAKLPAAPATTAAASTSAPAAKPDAVEPWAPPSVIPAQPNWTWTAMDGTTYQNVVITKIEPDTVTITHSLGVSHVPINLLPPDIRKQLNYDPHAASRPSSP